MKLYIYCFAIFLVVLAAEEDSPSKSAIKGEEIVPDVIGISDSVPQNSLNVSYGNKIVDFGNLLAPSEAKNKPKVSYGESDKSKFYLLAMSDPDAPSRKAPTFREIKHWLVGNIAGNDFDPEKGVVMADYRGPGPPKGSGKHRYIFLLYAQPGKLDWTQEIIPKNASKLEGRVKWSIRDFAKKYNLSEPVAANFFLSEKA